MSFDAYATRVRFVRARYVFLRLKSFSKPSRRELTVTLTSCGPSVDGRGARTPPRGSPTSVPAPTRRRRHWTSSYSKGSRAFLLLFLSFLLLTFPISSATSCPARALSPAALSPTNPSPRPAGQRAPKCCHLETVGCFLTRPSARVTRLAKRANTFAGRLYRDSASRF